MEKCEVCMMNIITLKPIKRGTSKIDKTLEVGSMISTDLAGPIQPTAKSGKRYVASYIDHASRYVWVYCLEAKSDQSEALRHLLKLNQTQHGMSLKLVRSDNGGEFKSAVMHHMCQRQGIVQQFTHAYSLYENGIDERRKRTMVEMVRCLIAQRGLNKEH